mmetsp:Transcript_92104/g.219370  ORF Transcript_92104/g.219370 Transcript_92104/m.219370 type:complete len:226 (-) Transcript_92104:985-1662(-)
MRKVNDFWCHIVRCSDQGVGLAEHKTRETHVTDLGISMLIQQCILWFDVTVDNSTFVQVLERSNNTGCIEGSRVASWCILHENLWVVFDHLHQATTQRRFQEEIHVLSILVRPMQSDDKAAVNHRQYLTFTIDQPLRALLRHVPLRQRLQRVTLSAHRVLDQTNLAICTFPENTHFGELIQLDLTVALHPVPAYHHTVHAIITTLEPPRLSYPPLLKVGEWTRRH